jgi:hypothetical protein
MTAHCLRLLTLGPSKHGKTTFLKGLAALLGSWNKHMLSVQGQSDLFQFSIREAYHTQRTFEALARKNLLLDGVLLVVKLSELLDEMTIMQLTFALTIGVPLRLVIATHCDSFDDDEVMLDEYELALKQQLSVLGVQTDVVPVIRSDEASLSESAQECINALHRLEWGVPTSERPLRLQVTKTNYPKPSFEVSLQQGTLRLYEKLELLRYERLELQPLWLREIDLVSKIVTEAGEQEQLSAPSFAEIWLHGAARKPSLGALLSKPGGLVLGQRAKAQVYMGTWSESSNLWIPSSNNEKVLCSHLASGPTERFNMIFAPERGFLRAGEICEAELECLGKYSSVFLVKGQSFFWRVSSFHGGGVVTTLL